jgi:hypothetical protein
MIKHGSKMIQAVTCATVPQITIQCGASFGAGNYGMCGRGYAPRFLFSWPLARTAVMGGEQAAQTMRIVAEGAAARKGVAPDAAALDAQSTKIVEMFERQADAFYTSGLLLGRRRDRPARHAGGARRMPAHVPRGRSAGAAADAVRRGADVVRGTQGAWRCNSPTSTRNCAAPCAASSTPRSTRMSTSGRPPRSSRRTRCSRSSATWGCWA